MAKIPEIKLKIESLIENKIIILEPRPYLGISQIGKACARALWYDFRWTTKKQITARQERLFQRGHREEPIIIADLKAIGCHVHSDQKEVIAVNGHVKGHNDGIVEKVPDAPKTPHLLEIKTMADKYFKKLIEEKVEKSNPEYYDQCQCYMKLLKLKRTLFICVNKNNDQRYYERIKYNTKRTKFLFERAGDIITSQIAPQRINSSPSWWQCKWCDHYDVCHFDEMPEKNCRTCQCCDIYDEGRWGCSHYDCWLTTEEQRKGCNLWSIWEALK